MSRKHRLIRFMPGRMLAPTSGELLHSRGYRVGVTEGYFEDAAYHGWEITSPLMGFKIPVLSTIFKPITRFVITVVEGEGYPLAPQRGARHAYRAAIPKASRPPAEELKETVVNAAIQRPIQDNSMNRWWSIVLVSGVALMVAMLAIQGAMVIGPRVADSLTGLAEQAPAEAK